MENLKNIRTEVKRIHGNLYEIVKVLDDKGSILQTINIPLKVELKIRDILQIIVGSSILAVPVAFTQEVWDMGGELAWLNTIILSLVCMLFIAAFTYFSAYRNHLKYFRWEFVKRVLTSFFLSLLVVGFLLTIVDKCPWFTDFDVALKRALIGTFPASLSATLTDSLS